MIALKNIKLNEPENKKKKGNKITNLLYKIPFLKKREGFIIQKLWRF